MARATRRHVVSFSVALPTGAVADHLSAALAQGGAALMIATSEHRRAVKDHLRELGHDVPHGTFGMWMEADAQDMIGRMVVDGVLDEHRFATEILPILPADLPGPVHVYGDMVAMLWAEGHIDAALRLEEAWNDIALLRPFVLLCGFPGVAVTQDNVDALATLCALHDAVERDAALRWGQPAALELSLSLPVAPEAPRVARHAAMGMLHVFAEEPERSDAALVVSELVTNALLHGDGPLHLDVRCDDRGAIRVAVSDGGTRPVDHRLLSGITASTGRGLSLVAALSRRWGTAQGAIGKTVWADIGPGPEPDTGS